MYIICNINCNFQVDSRGDAASSVIPTPHPPGEKPAAHRTSGPATSADIRPPEREMGTAVQRRLPAIQSSADTGKKIYRDI